MKIYNIKGRDVADNGEQSVGGSSDLQRFYISEVRRRNRSSRGGAEVKRKR